MNASAAALPMEVAEDDCALPLVRRLAAMLDRDPASLRDGDALPRGWHVSMFNPPTRQTDLRSDGAASLGVRLPDIGLPRLMLGGRQVRFSGDIPIGARLRRETTQGEVQVKQGRSGRFALVPVEHRIVVSGAAEAAVVERQEYVLREAAGAAAAPAPAPAAPPAAADAERTLVADERLLFRYSSITDNPHRIHYDHPYATAVEGYPALVVNGSIPAMFLLELFRVAAGREPTAFASRNVAPMYCGMPLRLCARRDGAAWKLWVEDERGALAFDARAE
ncbi:MAG: hypothetical protein JNM90_23165 [Burkholderiales bacterium]|nr:hypothetical protein [Burkholderiales bacterium]